MYIAASILCSLLSSADLALAPREGAPPAARSTQAPDAGALVHEGIVNAPANEVWSVFSTGEGFQKLGPAQAEIDLRVGGLIRSHYDPQGRLGDPGTIQNEILAFEPLRMITFRIHQPPQGFPFQEAWKDTWTVITLTDLGDVRTHVRFAMLGWSEEPQSQAMREFFRTGNDWTLKKLQSAWSSSASKAAPAGAHAEPPLAPITLEATVVAPREDVWRAWTTAQGWKDFFGVDARIGARPGEPFELEFKSDLPAGQRGSEGCTVLSSVPGEMFSFTWNAPPKFPRARAERTWVVVEFEPLSGGATRVRLRHIGFEEQAAAHPANVEEWQQVRAYFTQAWPRVLGALVDHFASKTAASETTAEK